MDNIDKRKGKIIIEMRNISTHTYTHTYTRTHVYKHTHTHVHTHTRGPSYRRRIDHILTQFLRIFTRAQQRRGDPGGQNAICLLFFSLLVSRHSITTSHHSTPQHHQPYCGRILLVEILNKYVYPRESQCCVRRGGVYHPPSVAIRVLSRGRDRERESGRCHVPPVAPPPPLSFSSVQSVSQFPHFHFHNSNLS